jgi:hypothetical protein
LKLFLIDFLEYSFILLHLIFVSKLIIPNFFLAFFLIYHFPVQFFNFATLGILYSLAYFLFIFHLFLYLSFSLSLSLYPPSPAVCILAPAEGQKTGLLVSAVCMQLVRRPIKKWLFFKALV